MKHASEELILKDDEGNIESRPLASKLKYDDKWALVKKGTPIITLIEHTEMTSTARGIIFPRTVSEQQKEVLDRDIAVMVKKEESPGVFLCRYKNYDIYVRYNDLIFTSLSKELATLKDKDKILV